MASHSFNIVKTNCWLFWVLFSSLIAIVDGAQLSGAPATLPADPGFKIHRTSPIQFPVVLLRDGIIHGEARILLEIDAEGQLVDTLVLAYTHEPFADAALSAIRRWRFTPARLNGETLGTVADCSIVFGVDGIVVHERAATPRFEKRDPNGPEFAYQAYDLIALDRIPTPQHVEPPIYPRQWSNQGMSGKVLIDFYIDETGAVRMPSGTSSTYPLLDAAATTAIRGWRFAPPLRKGKPVLAHCQQVFTFEPATAAQ